MGAGAAVAALVAAAVGLAPDPPQLSLFQSARTSQQVLAEVDAATYAPTEYEDYLRALDRAGQELAAQREKFYYSQQYLTFNRLSMEAIESSGAAERAARENRASVKLDVTRRSRDIQSTLADIRYRYNRLGLSNANRARLVRVEVLLREAELLGASEHWHEANDRVAAALSCVRTAELEQNERMSRFSDVDLVKQWDRWVQETIDWSSRNGTRAIIVVKSRNVCLLLDSGRMVRSYNADLGKNGVYDKSFRGDEATPEGKYKVIKKKGSGQSKYYKALLLNYPNDEDIRAFRRARTLGQLSRGTRLGGLIEIHGDGGRDMNWTQGCVALHNSDMDDIYDRAAVGTPVTIVGNYSAIDRLVSAKFKSGSWAFRLAEHQG